MTLIPYAALRSFLVHFAHIVHIRLGFGFRQIKMAQTDVNYYWNDTNILHLSDRTTNQG